MQALKDLEVAKQEFHIKGRLKHQPEFNLPNNRACFITHGEHKNKQLNEHEFLLMTVRSEGQFNSIIYEEQDSYRNIPHRWSVMMNKKDMQILALRNEDKIDLGSRDGKMKQVSVFEFDLPEKFLPRIPTTPVILENSITFDSP